MDLQNLITNEDREVLHELHRILPVIKNKYFSLGRDIDKFMKLVDMFGKPKENIVRLTVKQTIITTGGEDGNNSVVSDKLAGCSKDNQLHNSGSDSNSKVHSDIKG